jgi:hypothetical protein
MTKQYEDKEWLLKEFIIKNRSISSIAKENFVSDYIISKYCKKFNIVKNKKYLDKSWLIKKYIEENKTAYEIGEICNISQDMISLKLRQFNIKKDTDSIIETRKKTMLNKYGASTSFESEEILSKINKTKIEKYGTINTSALKEVKEKMVQTSFDRYGVETYLNTEESRKILKNENLKNNREKNIFGESTRYWSNKYDVNNYAIIKWDKSNKNRTKEDFISYLENFKKVATDIENIFIDKFGIDLYNNFFNYKEYPELRYKPDFKFNNKLAVNVDGLYWHSELFVDNKYHFEMREQYEKRGLKLLQFRADEIIDKIDIVQSILNYQLNKIINIIYARNTVVKSITQKNASNFLKNNHRMGTISANHIGLYFNEELVSIFSYREKNGILNVDRYCTKINTVITGGFGKLLKHVTLNNKNLEKIYFWVDLRYGTGEFLKNFNFKHKKDTLGWKWTDKHNTYNRLRCRANMDERGLSQAEYASELGWVKIYDAGQRLYIKEIK